MRHSSTAADHEREVDEALQFFGRHYDSGQSWLLSRDKTARVSVQDGVLNVDHKRDDPDFVYNEEDGTFSITVPRDSYRPLLVLKALTKNALNLIPENKIHLFQEAIAWVRNVDGQQAMFEGQSVGIQYLPGGTGSKSVLASLFFRTDDYVASPYCLFMLAFGNVVIQTYVFSRAKDWYLLGKSAKLPFFPAQSPDHSLAFGDAIRFVDDMSRFEMAQNTALRVVFKAESRRPV